MIGLILSLCLLSADPSLNDGRPGIKIDYELSGMTEKYKEKDEAFFVIKTEKDFQKILLLIGDRERDRLKELMPNFENQIGFFVFSRYKNRPEVQVTFEEINRQGPQPAGNKLVFDEVHVYCDVEYIRGNKETLSKQSYWCFALVSRNKLKQESDKTAPPVTDQTKFILFKRILVDTLQEPTSIK
jgi:hypothetical protein